MLLMYITPCCEKYIFMKSLFLCNYGQFFMKWKFNTEIILSDRLSGKPNNFTTKQYLQYLVHVQTNPLTDFIIQLNMSLKHVTMVDVATDWVVVTLFYIWDFCSKPDKNYSIINKITEFLQLIYYILKLWTFHLWTIVKSNWKKFAWRSVCRKTWYQL